ncbi:MAG TPA: hypothetical protein VGQ83_13690, partial [Polyangia bacterium]
MRVLLTAVLGVAALLASAVAAGAPAIRVAAAPDACPAPDAVAAAIVRLLPGARVVAADTDEAGLVVRIEDHGDG